MNDIEIKKIIQKCDQQIKKMDQKCMHRECSNAAINSHFMQRNGSLNLIANSGHLVELSGTDVFHWDEHTSPLLVQNKGIKKAFSLSLFCNHHDSYIFKEIETENVCLTTQRSYLLLTYRAICAEIKKKQDSLYFYELLLKSNIAKHNYKAYSYFRMFKEGNRIGLLDLSSDKTELEKELFIEPETESNFIFYHFEHDLIPLCVSAVFSPNYDNMLIKSDIGTLPSIYIHVVPQINNKMQIIVGYNSQKESSEIIKYIESWQGINRLELTQKLTELVCCHTETWCCSPSYYNAIETTTKTDFMEYWKNNALNHSPDQTINFNIFENSL